MSLSSIHLMWLTLSCKIIKRNFEKEKRKRTFVTKLFKHFLMKRVPKTEGTTWGY